MRSERFASTALMGEIAFGDTLYGSLAESDAAIERDARRARWERRKAYRSNEGAH